MARKRKEKRGEKKKPFPFFRPTSVGPTKEFPSATWVSFSPRLPPPPASIFILAERH